MGLNLVLEPLQSVKGLKWRLIPDVKTKWLEQLALLGFANPGTEVFKVACIAPCGKSLGLTGGSI